MGSNIYTQQKLAFSKNCLFDALVDLLEEKDIKDISVTELTQKAGVCRSTFYRNYNEVSDILVQFLKEWPLGFEATMTYDDYTNEGRVREYYNYLEANADLFRILVRPEYQHLLLESMESAFYGPFRPIVEQMGFVDDYEIAGVTGTIFMVTRDWFLHDMVPPKEEMIPLSTRLIERP